MSGEVSGVTSTEGRELNEGTMLKLTRADTVGEGRMEGVTDASLDGEKVSLGSMSEGSGVSIPGEMSTLDDGTAELVGSTVNGGLGLAISDGENSGVEDTNSLGTGTRGEISIDVAGVVSGVGARLGVTSADSNTEGSMVALDGTG